MIYPVDYRYSEPDRMLECAWVRTVLSCSEYEGKSFADFGGIIETSYGLKHGYTSYIPVRYNVTTIDVWDCELDNYEKCDLVLNKTKKVYDVGICVSALEHFGLSKYNGVHDRPDGDECGFRNMLESVRYKLLITVPAGVGKIHGGWIREYHPDRLEGLMKSNVELIEWYNISYFIFMANEWIFSCADDVIEFKNKGSKGIDCIACIGVLKNDSSRF